MRTSFLIKASAVCTSLFLLWTLLLMVINSSFSGQLYNPYGDPFGTMRFDGAHWLEDEQVTDGSNHRCRMVTDILHRYLATGSREADVVRLLGTPVRYDQKAMKASNNIPGTFSEEDLSADHILSYYLGEEIKMTSGINCAWLYLRFDAQGKYQGYSLFQPGYYGPPVRL